MIPSKYFIKRFITLLVATCLTIGVFYLIITSSIKKTLSLQYLHHDNIVLNSAEQTLETIFQQLASDLFFLTAQNEITPYLNGNDAAEQLLATEFKSFAEEQKQYSQIRFINVSGKEEIRINFDGTSATIVNKQKLQDKSNRYYFKDSITLNSGEIFVSPFDLNIEHGKIETPWKPTIRIATPVFDAEGDKRGVIVLNYLGENLLNAMESSNRQNYSQLSLLNKDGFWLYGAAPEKLWSFMFEGNSGFHTKYPEPWELIDSQESGMVSSNVGIFSFRTIHPLKKNWKTPNSSLFASSVSSSGDPETTEQSKDLWKIVSFITTSNYEKALNDQLSPIQLAFSSFTLFALFLCLLLAKSLDERNSAHKQLTIATNDAKAANKAKSEFLAQMSHDIRTPMTGILGMSEFLLESSLDDNQIEKVKIIHNSGSTLLQIINDILDLSKIEAGHFEIYPEPFQPRDLMKELIEILEPQAQAKGINLHCIYSTSLPTWIESDRLRLYQIAMNLISNAIRYTDKGEVEVQVTGKHQGDFFFLYITIRDTGIGVKEEELLTIFEPFVQSNNHTQRSNAGIGLGLAIVKRLIHRMGGEILVKSTYGKGTTFTFWIEAKIIDNTIPKPPTVQEAQPRPMISKSILLAEDNQVNSKLISMILEREGYHITTVTNGKEALETIPSNDFSLILLDIDMPVMDGIEATQLIRKDEELADLRIPIIAITAHAMQETRQICIDAGIDTILTKPINRKELIETVNGYLN